MTIGKQVFDEIDALNTLTEEVILQIIEKQQNQSITTRKRDENTVIIFYQDSSFFQIKFEEEIETVYGRYEWSDTDGDKNEIIEHHLH